MKKLPKKRIVLLGVGHTNSHVAKMWRMNPIPRTELVCISDNLISAYSGMLPGVLAGNYPQSKMEIDLVRFTASVGAKLITHSVKSVDPSEQLVHFEDRPPLSFDILSIGIGSRPNKSAIKVASTRVVAIKPMQSFLSRLNASLRQHSKEKKLRVFVVGGGVGGIEIGFCLPNYLQAQGFHNFELGVVNSSDRLARGVLDSTEKKIRSAFDSKGTNIITGQRVEIVNDGELLFADGTKREFDLVLWATSAIAPEILNQVPLSKDDHGFLLTKPTLQSVDCDDVFAVGDSGTLAEKPTRKAGVYAVRQGPVLWRNIHRKLNGESLEYYKPQQNFLKLLNTGDRKAIVEYKSFSFWAGWGWKLKDRIDVKFMEKYQEYKPLMMTMGSEDDEPEMRCLGCGGKIGGSILSRVLAKLDIPQAPEVLIGLDNPDDCAMVSTHGKPAIVTTDFFAAPLDDPYLVGRVGALNALSDTFVMGSKPTAALAIITLPYGRAENQEELMFQILSGSLHEFKKSGTSLVGGHTIEGPQLTVGYTIVAEPIDVEANFTKGELQDGDQLILTKPLGSGAILAAHMQAACPAETYSDLIETMLASNQTAAEIGRENRVSAMTDVTGFGFAGHLLEMLKASNQSAEIDLASVPLIVGAEKIFDKGFESTLAPANRDSEIYVDALESNRASPYYAAMFDPQTCGGVLLGVSKEKSADVLRQVHESGLGAAAIVGSVSPPATSGHSRLRII